MLVVRLRRRSPFLGEGASTLSICIADPRESEAPGIYAKAKPFLCALFDGFTTIYPGWDAIAALDRIEIPTDIRDMSAL
jgi:hypothetical protein